MAANYNNEEKGVPQNLHPTSASSSLGVIRNFFSRQKPAAHKRELHPRDAHAQLNDIFEEPLPHEERVERKLATFRRLSGISSAREHRDPHRPAVNIGLYARVCKNEKDALRTYSWSSKFITTILAGQVVVAATLTALGAGNGPHVVVTFFGAVNTIIAGILTYLKGSGIPGRYKYYASSWGKVREYMEQREREFEQAECNLDVDDVIKKVEAMYEEVRQDIDANQPEAYTSTAQLKRTDGVSPGPPLADHTGEYTHFPSIASNKSTTRSMLRPESKTMSFPNMPQNFSLPQQPGFSGDTTAVPGGSRFSGLDEKSYDFGGADIKRPFDLLRHTKSTGDVISYLPPMESVYEIDRRAQGMLAADSEKLKTVKDAQVEELKTRAGGVEKQGAAKVGQVKAVVKSEIEELQGAARTIGSSADKLRGAGEQILGTARTLGSTAAGGFMGVMGGTRAGEGGSEKEREMEKEKEKEIEKEKKKEKEKKEAVAKTADHDPTHDSI